MRQCAPLTLADLGNDPVFAARLAGYDPTPCPYCGQLRAVHSGTRHACDSCGARWVIAEEPPPQPDVVLDTT